MKEKKIRSKYKNVTWCKHIIIIEGDYVLKIKDGFMLMMENWVYCPRCGGSRP